MKFSNIFSLVSLLILLLVPVLLPTLTPVYSQAGPPVPGASVDIRFGPNPQFGVTTRVNQNGELSLNLYQGVNHNYNIMAKGYVPAVGNIAGVNNAGPVQLNVVLDPAVLIEGYVKTPDGKPVAGAIVSTDIDSTVTDVNGYFAVYSEPGAKALVKVVPPIDMPPLDLLMDIIGNQTIVGGMEGIFSHLPSGYKDAVFFEPVKSNWYVVYKEVNVTITGPVTQVNIELEFSARLAGTVTFQNGTAVENAMIQVFSQNMQDMGASGFSDQNGNYEIGSNLRNGPVNISVTLLRGEWILTLPFAFVNYNINCVLPCDTPQNLDINIPDLVRVSGRLIDKAGRPMPNVRIIGVMNDGEYTLVMSTDNNGFFTGFLPVGSQGNLTAFVSFGLPPIMNIALNVGNAPIDLGDVVANANLYYVTGTVQGYDPNDLYWSGTRVAVEAKVTLGPFQQITILYDGVIYNNGTFSVPVITNITIPFLPLPPNIQYSLVLLSSYKAAAFQPQALPDINQDVSNINVQVPIQNTFQLNIKIEASGTPPKSLQRTFIYTASYAGKTFNISVSSDSHLSAFGASLLIFNPRGELYLYFSTVPGSNQFTITLPTDMLGEPYTLSYYSYETKTWEPLNAQISSSGGEATITFSNPEGADTLIVKIESANVISEFSGVLWLLTILGLASMLLLIRKFKWFFSHSLP